MEEINTTPTTTLREWLTLLADLIEGERGFKIGIDEITIKNDATVVTGVEITVE